MGAWSVDNAGVTNARPKSVPLPCALLALSVAVCLGAAGPVEASALRSASTSQAEHRETFEALLEVIQQAAKKLTDRLQGQSAVQQRPGAAVLVTTPIKPHPMAQNNVPADHFLREALLNLPPPAC